MVGRKILLRVVSDNDLAERIPISFYEIFGDPNKLFLMAFLRRMIDLLCCFRNLTRPIRPNVEFHRNLTWWLEFFVSWGGFIFSACRASRLSQIISFLPILLLSAVQSFRGMVCISMATLLFSPCYYVPRIVLNRHTGTYLGFSSVPSSHRVSL